MFVFLFPFFWPCRFCPKAAKSLGSLRMENDGAESKKRKKEEEEEEKGRR